MKIIDYRYTDFTEFVTFDTGTQVYARDHRENTWRLIQGTGLKLPSFIVSILLYLYTDRKIKEIKMKNQLETYKLLCKKK